MEPEDVNDGDPERMPCSLLLLTRTRLIEAPHAVKLTLDVTYPDAYPDVLPELSMEVVEGELEDSETSNLLSELQAVVCFFSSLVDAIR